MLSNTLKSKRLSIVKNSVCGYKFVKINRNIKCQKFTRINRGYFWNYWSSSKPTEPPSLNNQSGGGGQSGSTSTLNLPQKTFFVAGIDEEETSKRKKFKDKILSKRIELKQKVSESELSMRAKKFSLKFFMRNSRMVFYIMYKHWVEDYIEYIMLLMLYLIL